MADEKKKSNPWAGKHEWAYKDRKLFCDGKPVMSIARVCNGCEVAHSADYTGECVHQYTTSGAEIDALGEWITERLQVEAILNAMLAGGVIT